MSTTKSSKASICMSHAIPVKLPAMPRKTKYPLVTPARFAPGTFDRIQRVLGATEDRADFIRHAVEVELQKRERDAKRAEKEGGGDD